MDFVKQGDEPLFPDILWSRPLTRNRGGRLLAIGGHSRGFAGIQATHQLAEAAGIGECLVAMPDSLHKLVGDAPDTLLLPSSPSGSLGKAGLGELTHQLADCDGMLLGIDLTNNSETAVLIESLLASRKTVLVTEEALDTLPSSAKLVTDNTQAVIVGSMNAVINIANRNNLPVQIRPEKELVGRVEVVQQVAASGSASYVVIGKEIIVAVNGKISVTSLRGNASAYPAVQAVFAPFLLQNISKKFEALTTAAFIISKALPADHDLTYGQIASSIRTTLQHFS